MPRPSRTRFSGACFEFSICASKESADFSPTRSRVRRSEEHTSELQSLRHLVCRLLLEQLRSRSEEHTSELQSLRHLVSRLLLEQNIPPQLAALFWFLLSPPSSPLSCELAL